MCWRSCALSSLWRHLLLPWGSLAGSCVWEKKLGRVGGTLFRCLAEHGKFCVIYYFRGQSEYVLKIVTVTPFRKVALVPKYQPCLVHRVLRAGKERQCTVAWSLWVFAVMHALLPTMHLLKTGKSCLCSSMQSCAATGLVQKCSPGASCFFPKRLGQSRAVIQAAAVHDKRLPVRSPARPSGPGDRNRWLGPVPCGPAIVRPIRGDVPSGLRHLPWGHSPVLGLPAARVYDSGPADGKP